MRTGLAGVRRESRATCVPATLDSRRTIVKRSIPFPLILIAFCPVSGLTSMDAVAGPAGSPAKSENTATAIEAAAFMKGV